MNQYDKDKLALDARRKHTFQQFKNGLVSLIHSPIKILVLLGYLVTVILAYTFKEDVFIPEDADLLVPLYRMILPITVTLISIVGLFYLIVLFGSTFGGGRFNAGIQRTGLKNYAGESPRLLSKRQDKENPRVTVMEFTSEGIPVSVWEDKWGYLESALDVNIVKIIQGKSKKRILLYTVPARTALSERVDWKREYLTQESFALTLGESLMGPVTVNLKNIPHILLGGSTGSGKSVMLKLILMQCVEKGAEVYIADFKGGVDFPKVWHQKCRMIFDEILLLDILKNITDTLEQRKEQFRTIGCASIDEYNRQSSISIPRIVFACDEVAELLDKTGLSKESKEQIAKTEAKLAVIARQGRAFGIHLIFATQRPDATILSGQIRNNIDCRICGRADNVLSQIILDNTDAGDRIPKDAQGRFLLHDGTLFQGYWFDEAGW